VLIFPAAHYQHPLATTKLYILLADIGTHTHTCSLTVVIYTGSYIYCVIYIHWVIYILGHIYTLGHRYTGSYIYCVIYILGHIYTGSYNNWVIYIHWVIYTLRHIYTASYIYCVIYILGHIYTGSYIYCVIYIHWVISLFIGHRRCAYYIFRRWGFLIFIFLFFLSVAFPARPYIRLPQPVPISKGRRGGCYLK